MGNFSYKDRLSSYSTNNALIIEVKRAIYTYVDRYYQNINGNVTSWMYWEDPITGLTSPRILGDSYYDEDMGPHYVVFDLDTNELVDFVSILNYPYIRLGREPNMSNLRQFK